MASKLLKDLQAEIQANIVALKPIIEGFEDYLRLNITPETQTVVKEKLRFANTRRDLLVAADEALTKLDAQGYPDFDATPVNAAVMADLEDQKATITAAIAKFVAVEEAQTAKIEAGAAVDKP